MTVPAAYIPPFVSERPLPFSECGTCVGIMGAAGSSLGANITHHDGTLFSHAELETLQNQLRASVGINDPSLGQSIGQVDRMLQLKWPEIPPMQRPIGDTSGLRLTWAQFVAHLDAGWCAIVNGNPITVTDPNSPLRTIQNNDNYAHSIHVAGRTVDGKGVVQNPLGGWQYPDQTDKGWQPVPMKDISQFAWRTPDGAIYAGLWFKGAAVPAAEPPTTGTPTPPPEGTVYTLATNLTGYSATVKQNTNVRPTPDRSKPALRTTSAAEAWPSVVGFVKGEAVSGSDQWLMRYGAANSVEFVHASTLGSKPTAPISEADYTAKVTELEQKITSAKEALA